MKTTEKSSRASGVAPYQVDNAIYRRFDAKNAIFSRSVWDEIFIEKVAKVKPVYQPNDPGYTHLDSALVSGAVFNALFAGTYVPFLGPHTGSLSFEKQTFGAPHGPDFKGKWDISELSGEAVAAIIKKVARYYGASLVGISQLDERWIYSKDYDMLMSSGHPIIIKDVEKPLLQANQVAPEEAYQQITAKFAAMEPEAFKSFIINVLETTDRSLLPSNLPPVNLLKMYPAHMMQSKLTTQITFPTRTLRVFANRLEMGFEIANLEIGASEGPHYMEDGTLVIPSTMRTVITMAFEMDYDLTAACPTQQSDAAVQYGYSNMATAGASLARFLMGLGYNAIPCGNNTGLCIPLAVDAGLGELGRNGLLITEKFGPRVRIGKVITDLPTAYDHPVRFGLKEFCEVCGKCAIACPVQAISHSAQTDQPINISTNPGVMKWPVDGEKCYISWMREGSSCGLCIKACPFNKPDSRIHDAARIMVKAKLFWLDRILVKIDDLLKYGKKTPKFGFFPK